MGVASIRWTGPITVEPAVAGGDAAKSTPLRDLIRQQDVRPVEDLDELAALWPGDEGPEALLDYLLADRAARRELAPGGDAPA